VHKVLENGLKMAMELECGWNDANRMHYVKIWQDAMDRYWEVRAQMDAARVDV
jgi:hypothetical protein